ncbi:MAG: hypothetical protein AAFV07_05725, partial [Bacteroidota bacterium]
MLPAFLVSFSIKAQDALLNSAVRQIEEQSYEEALGTIDKALGRSLKSRNIPRAYILRSRTYIGLWRKRMRSETDASSWSDGLLLAASDYAAASKTLEADRFEGELKELSRVLRPLLMEEGLGFLNQAYRLQDGGDRTPEALFMAQKYLEAVDLIYPDYLSHDLMGQTLLLKRDSLAALESFRHAITSYEKNGPVIPDILIAYAYFRGGLVEQYYNRNLDAALFLLDRGKQTLRRDYQRMLDLGGNLTPDQIRRMDTQYKQAEKDLDQYEMEILTTYPTRRTRALVELRAAMEDNPT